MSKTSLKTLTEALTSFSRARFANIASKTFGGKRDMYRTLGYIRELQLQDYRARYRRNEVANRIVKARPKATWRGGGSVVDDMDPTKEGESTFEAAFADLDNRHKIWDTFKRADILAGIGRYAIILIGAPGELETPLESVSGPEDIAYLSVYAEEDATVERFEVDKESPRFGLPVYYTVKRTQMTAATAVNSMGAGRRVHWTRVLHIADGLLDDRIYGEPRLECVWNRLDDLEKVAGGGSEAFWRRADQGTQFDIDSTVDVDADDKKNLQAMLEEYEHGFRRYLTTRGMKINTLGSDVADFKSPVESIISLISAGTGIPQRVLMGSEQGKLAAKQDRASWDNEISDRQRDYAGPCVVRPFVDKMIALGALPEPDLGSYDVIWSSISQMDDEQRAKIGTEWAGLGAVTRNELRVRVLNLEPLEGELGSEILGKSAPNPFNPSGGFPPRREEDEDPDNPRAAARKKGGAAYQVVHRAADRFRRTSQTYHQCVVQRRQRVLAKEQPPAEPTRIEGRGGYLTKHEWGN